MRPLPRCFLSNAIVIELAGQATQLPPYMLREGDAAALEQGAYGHCYFRELIASPWGPFWAARSRDHALARGLRPLGRFGDWEAFHYTNVEQIEAIRADGLKLSPRKGRTVRGPDGRHRVPSEQEFNLILRELPDAAEIIAPVHAALRADGVYPLVPLLDRLGLSGRMWIDELQGAELRFDDELTEYWSEDSLSVRLHQEPVVPDELVHLLD